MKRFELEFSVDPLFKKASADFDEGGAKGLLLNHLAIDSQGRIVFDSSDEFEISMYESGAMRRTSQSTPFEGPVMLQDNREENMSQLVAVLDPDSEETDLSELKAVFFPDLAILDDQDICPSLRNFDLSDPIGTLDIPLLKPPGPYHAGMDTLMRNLGDQSGIMLDDENSAGFNEDHGLLTGFNMPVDTEFGEGGEAWARDPASKTQTHLGRIPSTDSTAEMDTREDCLETVQFRADSGCYKVSVQHRGYESDHENILDYFDNALKKSWAGPEHWRIRRMKDLRKCLPLAPVKRKEKEPFEVNFAEPIGSAQAELIYTPAVSNATICLPKTQWSSKARHLLPDDKCFNSRQLSQLFLKSKARVGSKRAIHTSREGQNRGRLSGVQCLEVEEAFWAHQAITSDRVTAQDGQIQGNYDANFFQDDGLVFLDRPDDDNDIDNSADAREEFSPGLHRRVLQGSLDNLEEVLAIAESSQDPAFGSQLVTQNKRARPEYVQCAKIAKKVDVRRLKEEMWRGIGFEEVRFPPKYSICSCVTYMFQRPFTGVASLPTQSKPIVEHKTPLRFTSVMNSLQVVYPKQAMADISTSYCFICLLHLANEKGLTLNNENSLEEVSINKNFST